MRRTRIWFSLLIVSLLVIGFNRILVPNIRVDWLNIIPLAATLYLGYSIIAFETIWGHSAYVRRCLGKEPGVPKPRGAFLLSHWFRTCLLLVVTAMSLEFGLRCLSYHRSLVYETQGDLLFTPIPNQAYMEKISLTQSTINNYGLRGGPIDTNSGKEMILCLGDSVTYGYGLDDAHSYPTLLQAALDREFPGRYSVVNGGVDAYPIAFEDQKFLYLWQRGLRPKIVVVGYSFNEGWLGHLVDSSELVKRQFARRVWLKNQFRSFALYNVVVENLARRYYDKMKDKLVPGTNFAELSQDDLDRQYARYLERFLTDLQSRNVKPVFLLFCGFNRDTGNYDAEGPFAERFAEFAQKNSLPLFRSDRLLRGDEPNNVNLAKYFIDQIHMNNLGTQKVAAKLAELLSTMPEKPLSAAVN